MTENPDLAAKRFAVMQLARLSGAVLVLFGIIVLSGKAAAILGAIPKVVGYVLAAVGLFEFFALPTFLARRWKTPNK